LRKTLIGLVLILALALSTIDPHAAQNVRTNGVTYQDLRDGFKNTSRWLTYSGDYTSQRHSPLTQITPSNVDKLAEQWSFNAEGMSRGRGFESTPLLLDGVLYITGTNNWAWAIDARTGRAIWQYKRALPTGLTYGGGNIVNRGFGLLGNSLFMATLDAHVIALDRMTGNILWDTTLAPAGHGLLYIVMDYVDGPSLVTLVGDTPMAPHLAASWSHVFDWQAQWLSIPATPHLSGAAQVPQCNVPLHPSGASPHGKSARTELSARARATARRRARAVLHAA